MVKKIILVVLWVLLAFSSCNRQGSPSGKEVGITDAEVPQAVGLEVGDTLEVTLPANPSTGYAWEVGFYNQSVLKLIGEAEFVTPKETMGKEGQQRLHFEAIGEGETELRLMYRRPFEKNEPEIKIFSLEVTVR